MVGDGLSEMSYRRRMAVEAKLESLTTFQNLTLMTVADKHQNLLMCCSSQARRLGIQTEIILAANSLSTQLVRTPNGRLFVLPTNYNFCPAFDRFGCSIDCLMRKRACCSVVRTVGDEQLPGQQLGISVPSWPPGNHNRVHFYCNPHSESQCIVRQRRGRRFGSNRQLVWTRLHPKRCPSCPRSVSA